MRQIKLTIILTFIIISSIAQSNHKIIVSFLHGSKPYREQRRIEYKETGGYYGGHVSIIIDSIEFGFTSGKRVNIFPSRKHPNGIFYCEELKDFKKDTIGLKYTTIEIPINDEQYTNLKLIIEKYLGRPPYDYAFFGMRCASATYDVLSQIGIVKTKSHFSNVVSNFYPKLLRYKMRVLAKKNHYRLIIHKGKKTRIWEDDEDED
jgi:hypothetical protein